VDFFDRPQVGDLIRTSWKIPTMPVKPIEGDSYPLGALPVGTTICLVQWYPDSDVVKVKILVILLTKKLRSWLPLNQEGLNCASGSVAICYSS